MDRGVSTVLDVGLACLLVTASATLLVATPGTAPDPPDADRVGRAILLSTVVVDSKEHAVDSSIGDRLANAVRGGRLSQAERTSIRDRMQTVHPWTTIVASVDGDVAVAIGVEPGPGVPVDAAVFRIGRDAAQNASNASTEHVVIVVRTWSP